MRTVRAFLPALLASRGYVLQVASLAAMVPAPMMSAYCASKSGVEAFAHALRAEVRHHGVDVGVALPLLDRHRHGARRRRDAGRAVSTAAGCRGCSAAPTRSAPAVARLADGVEGRRAHVYGQGWVRAVQGVRSVLPAVLALGSRSVQEVEQALAPGR